jgi:hypothetical protein
MRGDSMSKKYYFTCPIQALYMMEEFGVKYDFENEESLIRIIKTPENRRDNFMRKIYVSKESQKIFKFKKSDLVKYGFGSVGVYNEISQKHAITEIIYRNGKQFFMPEVEQ